MPLTDSPLRKLFDVISDIPAKERPNLILTRGNQLLFCYRERLSFHEYAPNYGPVDMNPERGDIMDFFADIELIVNQIIVTQIVRDDSTESKFEQLLDFLDLFSKIKLLKDWGLINGAIQGKLICLKEVRNGFAHCWDIKAIEYKGSPVMADFNRFKADALEVFTTLADLYNGGEVSVDDLIVKYQSLIMT